MYPGSPKHPIFGGGTFGLMSGEKPLFKPQVEGGHEALGSVLDQMGLKYEQTSGKYKEPERSYIIHSPSEDQMKQLGKMFGQESVIHSQNGHHKLIYTNGDNEGAHIQAAHQTPIEHFEKPPEDFYTSIPGHGHFRINFDWNKLHKSEKEFEPEDAAFLAKNAIANLIALKMTKPHPHAYEWHDGHTEHHIQDFAQPNLHKAGEQHPHMDAPPKNDQAAGVGVSTYKQFALPFGDIKPGGSTDLLHYKYHNKLPEIEKLVADHGYKTYYAGGKYGKPDLANKNYNTGHLMVYDPTPSSGGDFGHENYTKGWRQIHELAHALTYPEVNKIYGEGRRIGKLGTHRSLNEALRAVHWEWLAAHKQRELSNQVGVPISDQDFHKELNTVMHDAAHRAVTGKFTEPSGEGFAPHGHKVPLHTALQMLRDEAHKMGLHGLHNTLKDQVAKSEGNMKKNIPPQPKPPMLHSTFPGFMAGLNAIPKGSPERGKFITAHMSHPPFLTALKAHPEGKEMFNTLSNYLNSAANAGLHRGAKVTVKSDTFSKNDRQVGHNLKSEQESPMADEKVYSVEEANDFLLKATKEKLSSFEKNIKELRERELKKAVIPPHKHNPGLSAGSASEDIPPLEANPKGIDKGEMMDGGAAANTTPASMAMNEKCEKCTMAKTMCKCMGKSDLVDAKGNLSDNHTVAGSKMPPKKTSEAQKGTDKDPGSGGIVLPGAHLFKKSEKMEKALTGHEKGVHLPGKTWGEKAQSGGKSKAGMHARNAGRLAEQANASGGEFENREVRQIQHNQAKRAHQKVIAQAASIKPNLPKSEIAKDEAEPLMKPPAKSGKLPAKKEELDKSTPPMAKPPSGANMGTKVPTSAPKPPKMEKAALSPGQHEVRANNFAAATAGAFQPKAPVHSGLELDRPAAPKPAAALPKPKAAMATAKPAVAINKPKPGIFGKLFGKG